ncbi:MAG: SAM-dependent methyltransferase [Clostridia bacterium]|nr:SAM-dependent methyltransferase [Clostridia bacterium]
MANIQIDPRLLSAASFVRAGAVFADIGTDHGYLPVFLLSEGRIKFAFLSDVNEGPLEKASENIRRAGLREKCELLLADGAASLAGRGVTDYAICGMGGELIADIIARAPHLADPCVRLILQPMSRQEHLRRALYRLGFFILGESYSVADGKRYVCMCVGFSGTPCEISDSLAYLGPDILHTDDRDAYLAYLAAKRESIARAAAARSEAGLDDGSEKIIALFDGRIKQYL